MNMESYRQKIKDLRETKTECKQLKGLGKRIVFTNGCFDILHPGHTRYLSAARELGDYLVVAVNSDRSVRSIKGAKRPILSELARAELIAALSSVGSVLIFDEDNPLNVILNIMPDILVKGGDWKEEEIIGADEIKKAGGEVRSIPFVTGFSTTVIIKKVLSNYS